MHAVFDLDGVLLDSESDLSWLDRALDRTLTAFDLPVTERNRGRLFPATNAEFEEIASDAGVAPTELWATRDSLYIQEKRRAIESGELHPFDDVSTLYQIEETGLHIISNSPREIVETFVTANDYEDLFSVRIGRGSAYEDLDRLKPNQAFYHELLQATGDPTATYAYIGHTESDKQFAKNTGMAYIELARDDGDTLDDLLDRFR